MKRNIRQTDLSEARVRVAETAHRRGNSTARADRAAVKALTGAMRRRGYDAAYPILVEERDDETDDWTIIDGRHRVLAAKAAGIEEIPAIVIHSAAWTEPARRCFGGFVADIRRLAGYQDEEIPLW